MPPPPEGVPAIVFGDCRGRTADAWVSAEAMAIVKRLGLDAGLNDPFAGGHVIERHGRPANGAHSLQVEIDRRCYLDTRLMKPGRGFDRVATLIETLAVELGQELLGRRYATAAE
jgi:N-formylglutamate amidohydrolase